MSTYLQLCQDVRRECGIPGTGPTSVSGNTGELDRVVNWVEQAYREVQNRHNNWRFLRKGFTLTTVASDDTYAYGDVTDDATAAAITRFSDWRIEDLKDPPKIYLQSAGSGTQRWMTYTPWEYFKSIYKIGTQNTGAPVHITFDPNDNIVLGPSPDAVYIITGDYYRSAQVLAADSDTPEMPSQYHDLIVYKAMEKYGFYEAAQEFLAKGEREARRVMRQLELNQLPKIRLGRPLA